MVDEALSARLSAVETISRKMRDISNSVETAADKFTSVANRAAVAAETIDRAGDEAADSSRQVSRLNAAIRALPERATVSIDTDIDRDSFQRTLHSFTTDRTVAVNVARSVQETVDAVAGVDLDGSEVARAKLQRVASALNRLDGRRARIAVDVDSEGVTLPAAIRNLDDLGTTIDTAVDVDSNGLHRAQLRADGLGDALRDVAISSRVADDALDAISGAAPGLSASAAAADAFDDEALQATASAHLLAEGLDDVGSDAVGAAAGAQLAASRIDEVGDEATGTLARVTALSGALSGLSAAGAGSELSAHLGPLGGSLGTITAVLATVLPMLGSLTTAAGGLVTAITGVAGAFAGIFAGGILSRAEELKATSEDIEDTADAIEKIFGDWRAALSKALEPLKTEAFEAFTFDMMDGVVSALSDAAVFVNRLAPALMTLADIVGQSFWDTEPAFFAELEATVRAFLPTIEALATGTLEALPKLFRFMREEGTELMPVLMRFGDAFLDATPPIIEFGTTMLSLVLPVLTAATKAAGAAATAFTSLPEPIQKGLIATAGLAAVIVPLAGLLGSLVGVLSSVGTAAAGASGVLGTLAAAVGAVTLPVSGTVVAIAALVGALVAVIDYFELWDDIATALATTFNYFIEYVELVSNVLAIYTDIVMWAVDGLIDFLTPFDSAGDVLSAFGAWLGWAGGEIKSFAKMAWKYIQPVVNAIGALDAAIGEQGGVSLDEYKVAVEEDDDIPGPPPAQGLGPGTRPAAAGATGQSGRQRGAADARYGTPQPNAQPYQKNEITVNVQGGGDSTEARVRRAAEQGYREAQKKDRRRTEPTN